MAQGLRSSWCFSSFVFHIVIVDDIILTEIIRCIDSYWVRERVFLIMGVRCLASLIVRRWASNPAKRKRHLCWYLARLKRKKPTRHPLGLRGPKYAIWALYRSIELKADANGQLQRAQKPPSESEKPSLVRVLGRAARIGALDNPTAGPAAISIAVLGSLRICALRAR